MKEQNNLFSRRHTVGVALLIVLIQIFSTSITYVTGSSSSIVIPKIKHESREKSIGTAVNV